MTDPAPGEDKRAAPTILALIGVFALPVIIAWWLAVARPPGDVGKLLNHGTFIQPPLDIAKNPMTKPLAGIKLAPGEWAMVYVGGGGCDTACRAALDRLATIRSLLGQAATRLRVAALIDEAMAATPGVVVVTSQGARSAVSSALNAQVGARVERAIVFLDWRGQVMMFFDLDAPPSGIKKDINRLLRGSKIK